MRPRLVLVMFGVGAAAALWLLGQAGVEVPGEIWTVVFAAFGVWNLLTGLLLRLRVLRPSAFWGHSAVGATLVGVGILLLVVSGAWGSSRPDTLPEVLIAVIGLVCFAAASSSSTKRGGVRKLRHRNDGSSLTSVCTWRAAAGGRQARPWRPWPAAAPHLPSHSAARRDNRVVRAHTSPTDVRRYGEAEEPQAGGTLQGFRVRIGDLFAA